MQPELFHIPARSEPNAEIEARKLAEIHRPPVFAAHSPPLQPATDPLSEKDYALLAEMLSDYVGIRLPPTKRVMMEGRLRRRVRALGLPSLAEYCRLLAHDDILDSEFVHLVDAVTTN